MPAVVETHHPPVDQIVAGHFHEGPGYSAWRSKGTDDWLLIYTAGGRGRFGFVGGEVVTAPGDIVLLRPGTLHDYGVEPTLQRWELIWSHFHPRPDWVEWLDWPEEAPGLMRLRSESGDTRKRIEALIESVYQFTVSAHRRRTQFAMNAMESLLLWCDTINPRSQQARIDPRIRAAMDHICRRLGEAMSLEDVAEVAGLSVSRMAHLFREQAGVSPQQFIEQQRMHRACQLLGFTQRSIKEISRDVGYDNPFYFTQRFKKHTGASPRAYRVRGSGKVEAAR
jgi:AraC family transcriptional regulator, arabinose operon regulatory protein